MSALDPDRFVAQYLAPSRPVIVTDAMQSWKALREWTPGYFRERFGDEVVQIYDDLFFMVSARPLREYVDRFVHRAPGEPPPARAPYVRWYSRQDARIDFPWSDHIFARLADDWTRPYFMPERGLLLPRPAASGGTVDPVRDSFPARGIFISAQGARTRLHVDPWASDAMLCQVHGRKRFALFRPADQGALERDGKLVDLRYDVASDAFVAAPVEAYADDCLEPGEVILIPAGWPHAFQSVTASISITWNFLHEVNEPRLAAYLARGVPRGEAASLAYFSGSAVQAEVRSEAALPR